MTKQLLILLFVVLMQFCATNAAPTTAATTTETTNGADEVQMVVQPQIVTLAYLETLLKRAGEMFRPGVYQPMAEAAKANTQNVERQEADAMPALVAVPYQYMQPPNDLPYNFYLPLYDHDDTQLDGANKYEKFKKIAPPPKPGKATTQTNYYAAVKPKKIAKKFNAAHKHINMKWLNAYEKDAGEIPKVSYLATDERNRINFDDSFFAVDMLVKAPDNNVQTSIDSSNSQQDEYQTEEGEDLMAAAAAKMTQISVS